MLLSKPAAKTPNISLTPLVDVVFILLLFFMLTSVFESSRQIPLSSKSPAVSSANAPKERAQVIALGEDSVWVNGQALSLHSSEFEALALRWKQEDKPVAVGGKTGAKIQHLISLIDHLHSIGLRNINVFESVEQL